MNNRIFFGLLILSTGIITGSVPNAEFAVYWGDWGEWSLRQQAIISSALVGIGCGIISGHKIFKN